MKDLSKMISRRGIIQSAGLASAGTMLGTMPGFAAAKGGPRALALIGVSAELRLARRQRAEDAA